MKPGQRGFPNSHSPRPGPACLGLPQGKGVGAATTGHEDRTVASKTALPLPLYSPDCCRGSRKPSSPCFSVLNIPFSSYCLSVGRRSLPLDPCPNEWHPISPTLMKNLEPAVTMLIYLVLLDENCNYNSTDAVQSKTSSCCNHHSSASFEGNYLFIPVRNLALF